MKTNKTKACAAKDHKIRSLLGKISEPCQVKESLISKGKAGEIYWIYMGLGNI